LPLLAKSHLINTAQVMQEARYPYRIGLKKAGNLVLLVVPLGEPLLRLDAELVPSLFSAVVSGVEAVLDESNVTCMINEQDC
jgi:hypothetical protein